MSFVITVRALISMRAIDDGGLSNPVSGRYRPNHNFSDNASSKAMYIGEITVPEGKFLRQGKTIEALVEFIDDGSIRIKLIPGARWNIQEGLRVVGTGTVIEVLN